MEQNTHTYKSVNEGDRRESNNTTHYPEYEKVEEIALIDSQQRSVGGDQEEQRRNKLERSKLVKQRMSKTRAQALARKFKWGAVVASFIGFGMFSGLVFSQQAGATTTSSQTSSGSSSQATSTTQNNSGQSSSNTSNQNGFLQQQGGNSNGTSSSSATPVTSTQTS